MENVRLFYMDFMNVIYLDLACNLLKLLFLHPVVFLSEFSTNSSGTDTAAIQVANQEMFNLFV